MTATAPGRRGIGAWAERGRAAWWRLPARDRMGVEGLLLAGALVAAGWRAGHLGLVEADFVLTVLGGLVGVVFLYRGAVYRPQPAAPPTGPLVTPSEEAQRHAAREAGGGPGACP
ncbi:hypothetical protein EF910_02175 [Streptomyces sp. WAC07149]|uniref:hypothetical protein n=1 Tax=Streptomyces sp. WAC07149 TaxID=2487425 RepID=UPI000F7687E6|nr:hypothetical protein [Streptomyces sp. WAC07149]RST09032.1 hypothetical protein EF910_02175 [Streptomyces sp. WAC07149]